MSEYKPYKYNGKTLLIERYLILGEQECRESEYDVFDMQVDSMAQNCMDKVVSDGYSDFEIFNDLNRENYNSFKYYKNPKNKKIFMYSEVFSETKTKILLNVQTSKSKSKLWVNGECLMISQDWTYIYLTAILNKGKNTILFEEFSPEEFTMFSIQIRNHKFEMSDDVRALSNMGHLTQPDPLIFISESVYRSTESTYRFMYMKNGGSLKKYYIVDIHDSLYAFEKKMAAKLDEVVEINIEELRDLGPETLRHEWIGCYLKDKNDNDVIAGPCIFLKDCSERAIETDAQLRSVTKELHPAIYANAMGLSNRLNAALKNNNLPDAYWSAAEAVQMLNQLKSGNHLHDFYKYPGTHSFFIHSKLDNSYIQMNARIPGDYDKSKAYPVFIALSTGNTGWFSTWIDGAKLNESYLCFDVTGRGFTGGSYIGEASTLEIIDWIKQNYKIDEDRIYLLGQSNGGFATWALAQNHPDIPAAIFPLIGYPQIDTVDNISNIPVYQMVSQKDHVFKGRKNEVNQKIYKYGNYYETRFKEMIHNSLLYYIGHKGVLAEMLKAKRNQYPQQIVYSTCRNRHLESFWIKLHGIERGKKFAKIKANIESNHTIRIAVSGASGLTVTLLPQIQTNSFNVVINGKSFHYENSNKSRVHFIRKKAWEPSEETNIIDYRKGTGLLDIYMDSMRIIIPAGAKEKIKNVAENFSKPSSNGAYPEMVITKYPVYENDGLLDNIFEHNLILLETDEQPNPYIKQFSERLPVQYDKNGYTYKGHCISGDYVIMQIIPNPYDNRRTLLVISTNNEKLLRKHILLRKVILPTYINGIHPLWNNELLIFNGESYLAAYETNDDLSPIKLGR